MVLRYSLFYLHRMNELISYKELTFHIFLTMSVTFGVNHLIDLLSRTEQSFLACLHFYSGPQIYISTRESWPSPRGFINVHLDVDVCASSDLFSSLLMRARLSISSRAFDFRPLAAFVFDDEFILFTSACARLR